MKGKVFRTVIACLVIAAIGFGGFYGYSTFFVKKTVAASVQYYAVNARKMNLQESIQGTGAAYAAATKDVMPNNAGTLKDLNIKVGDTVTAGQRLFLADSDQLRNSVTSAKNSLYKQNLTLSSDQNAAKVDDNKIAMDKIAVSDAAAQLSSANQQVNNMTVTAPISGVVTAVNNSNGDSVQSGKAVLTIQDMSSLKVKVSVDELDIAKVKPGQKAEIKFDAVAGKTFEGLVETVAPIGTTSNNVTTYDVVVTIANPEGIKPGMNGNINILVESKDNVLVVPTEALIENNGQKFVRVENTDSTSSDNTNQAAASNQQGQARNGQNSSQAGNNRNSRAAVDGANSKLVPIKTGLETQNYIEVTEGLTEGQKVLVQLPQTSTTTNNNNNRNNFGGLGGGMNGGFGGMNAGNRNNRNSAGSGAQNGNNGGARN